MTTQMSATQNVLRSPIFVEFITQLHVHGHMILKVPVTQLHFHDFLRKQNLGYVDSLVQVIKANNQSILFPMKACTSFDWNTLRSLEPLSPAPRDMIAHVFDGGHRLAAYQILRNQGLLEDVYVVLHRAGKHTCLYSWPSRPIPLQTSWSRISSPYVHTWCF
jgi:hypothetical protein